MKKILIVEDDLLQVFFLKKALNFLGHEVIGNAVRGARAIEMALELSPDIILMDIKLGGKLNGVETATEISEKMDCFIIFITGNSDENLINQAKKVQPSTILSKPITAQIIQNSIDSYLNTIV